ncbi:deoxyuridine 5'-triphosphate nucleotidohydrolase-like protein, partial [Leptotrombidium deliense]
VFNVFRESDKEKKVLLLVDDEFIVPNYTSDAGIDLFCRDNDTIHPFETKIIKTKHRIFLPFGYYATVHPRSSIALQGITIHSTIIDAGYTGDIFIIATSNRPIHEFKIISNDRLAQIVIRQVIKSEINSIPNNEFNSLKSFRGKRCLGSTNKQ